MSSAALCGAHNIRNLTGKKITDHCDSIDFSVTFLYSLTAVISLFHDLCTFRR
jgi:hypothetical protein